MAAQPFIDDAQDLREFDGYVPTGDAVDQEAARWLLRRSAGLDSQDEARLQAWLAADPAHGAALARHQATWAELDALPADGVAALRRQALAEPRQAQSHRAAAATRPCDAGRPARRGWVRRALPQAGMAIVLLAVVGGGWLGWDHWQQQPTFTKTYVAARGQQLNIELPDGSRLQLDTASRAEVSLYRQRREVRLREGQAMFTVTADPERPFDVLAGPIRVSVIGTRFAVRHRPLPASGVQVAVEEGRVRVTPAGPADGQGRDAPGADAGVMLTSGQAVETDALGALGPVTAVPSAGVAPWREGRVAFDGTRLSEALAEFERYGETGLRIDDPAVAALRINGSFDVRKAGNFAQALTRVLPLRLERRGNQTVIVMAR